MNHDELARSDAAYVLGSLSPAERRAYEEHLAECADCRQAVTELAGMPGLLAQVDASELLDRGESPPVPETLLPALLREVRRARRRRLAWSVGGAAAAAVLAGTGAVVWDQVVAPDRPPVTQPDVVSEPMRQVGQDVVTARLSMEEVAWGTRLELTCSYRDTGGDRYADDEPPSYTLAVLTEDGAEQVAQWRAVPGRTVTVPAATSAGLEEIRAVEVRTTSGDAVLELPR